jgi:hypothetical protein
VSVRPTTPSGALDADAPELAAELRGDGGLQAALDAVAGTCAAETAAVWRDMRAAAKRYVPLAAWQLSWYTFLLGGALLLLLRTPPLWPCLSGLLVPPPPPAAALACCCSSRSPLMSSCMSATERERRSGAPPVVEGRCSSRMPCTAPSANAPCPL